MSIAEKEAVIEDYRQSCCGKENILGQDWNLSSISIDDVPDIHPRWQSEDILPGYYDARGEYHYHLTHLEAMEARDERILQNEAELDRVLHEIGSRVETIRDFQHLSYSDGGYDDCDDNFVPAYNTGYKTFPSANTNYYTPFIFVFVIVGAVLFFSIYSFIFLVFR